MENQILRLITRFSRCLCKFFTIPLLSFFVLENICKIYIIFCPSMHLIMDKTVLALIYILNVCQPPQKTNSAHVEIKSRSWWSLYPVNCLVPFGSSSTRSFLFLFFILYTLIIWEIIVQRWYCCSFNFTLIAFTPLLCHLIIWF